LFWTVPKELNDARAAYVRATTGNANAYAPAELETAKEALDRAERSFDDDGDAPATVSLAYVASERQSCRGPRSGSRRRQNQGAIGEAARHHGHRYSGIEDAAARENLRRANEGETARIEAEKRMREAMARLQAIASIKDDPRGTIITIPGWRSLRIG